MAPPPSPLRRSRSLSAVRYFPKVDRFSDDDASVQSRALAEFEEFQTWRLMKDFHDFRSMQNRELGDANNFQQGHIEEVVNEDNGCFPSLKTMFSQTIETVNKTVCVLFWIFCILPIHFIWLVVTLPLKVIIAIINIIIFVVKLTVVIAMIWFLFSVWGFIHNGNALSELVSNAATFFSIPSVTLNTTEFFESVHNTTAPVFEATSDNVAEKWSWFTKIAEKGKEYYDSDISPVAETVFGKSKEYIKNNLCEIAESAYEKSKHYLENDFSEMAEQLYESSQSYHDMFNQAVESSKEYVKELSKKKKT